MKRIHGIEIHEQPWCPRSLRNAATDYLAAAENASNLYQSVTGLLQRTLEHSDELWFVDLCSGGGGPWSRLINYFDNAKVTLTDLYPNENAGHDRTEAPISYYAESVNALDIPAELTGVRTMFTGFHHFRPAQAKAILSDAVAKKKPIAIFEFTERTPKAITVMCVSWIMVIFLVPTIRPLKFSRIFWTYLLPAMLFVVPFDGIMSCLRSYTLEELREMTAEFTDFEWTIGQQQEKGIPIPVTYLLGWPKR